MALEKILKMPGAGNGKIWGMRNNAYMSRCASFSACGDERRENKLRSDQAVPVSKGYGG